VSPVGTPATPTKIAVRVIKKSGAKQPDKPAAVKDVENRDHLNINVSGQKSPSGGSDLSLLSGNTDTSANETLYLSAVADHSFDGRASSSDVVTTSASETNEGSDSDVEDSIYAKHRASFQEDSESVLDGVDGGNVEPAKPATSPMIMINSSADVSKHKEASCKNTQGPSQVSQKDVANNNGSSNDNNKATAPKSDVVTMFKKSAKRRILNSTSSGSSVNSLNLAMPSLAGFIESWNPFGSGRFFDTPPRHVDGSNMFGFKLKPDIAVGALSEADSQELMKLFDQVIVPLYYLTSK
jgi:hypothetical protein